MGVTRSEAVTLIKSWIGKKESDGSHKSIIDIYNKQTSLPRSYTLKYTDSWCAGTVTAVFQSLGAIDKIYPECSCGKMIEGANKMGIWKESDSYTPSIGDFCLYDWDDSGSGDCTGWPEHIGMVTEVSGSTFKVVEGNKSNAVGTRTMSVNGKYIRGFILPKYDDSSSLSSSSSSATLAVDGSVGPYTVVKWQKVMGTTQDGIVSNQPTSVKEYHYACSYAAWEYDNDDAGSAVIKAWQTYLNAQNSAGLKVDGWFGKLSIEATQTYLNKVNSAGLTVDGKCGELTAKALQTWLNKQ